jgi:deoxyribonuclease-4
VRGRGGVCLDTCHLYASGYDIVKDYDGVWTQYEEHLSHDLLGMMHLNDSKTPLGSRRDRHELIAEGCIGRKAFRRIMRDDRLAGVPKVIETPKLDDPTATDTRMLKLLRKLAG